MNKFNRKWLSLLDALYKLKVISELDKINFACSDFQIHQRIGSKTYYGGNK